MNKNFAMKDAHQGMAILALAIVSQTGPENLPNDIPDEHEEELPENTPDQQPEIDQDDFETDEEILLYQQLFLETKTDKSSSVLRSSFFNQLLPVPLNCSFT